MTLPGRFLVLVPFSEKISVSQKIKDPKERDRLKRLINSIRPRKFGVIIRTVAQDKKVAELDQDLKDLEEKWSKMYKELRDASPRKKLLGEMNRATTVLRDELNKEFTSIHVDDESLYNELKDYVKTIAPEKEEIVKLYKEKLVYLRVEELINKLKQHLAEKLI